MTVPGTAVAGGNPIVAAPTFTILAASAAITGTIQGGNNAEADIVAGNETIIITLTNDTWVPDDGTFAAQRQNIINGITSAGAEGTGWNTVVRDTLAVGAVVRTSPTVVTVTLPAFAGYNITANETITVTVPATAIASAGALTAAPTITITAALAVSAAVTGTIQAGANTEANIVTGGGTIIITLTNDTWVPDDGTFAAQVLNIVNGIDSGGAEGTGWDAVVKPALGVGEVIRTSATVVTVTVPALAGYNITANETITVTVPGTALTGGNPIVAAPTFTITFTAPPPPTGGGGAPARSQCTPGFFSSDGFSPCGPAPAGSFVAGFRATSAALCAPGSFSNTAGRSSCTLAPLNTYVATAGATSATACPAGATTATTGSTSEGQCRRPNQVSNVSLTANNYQTGQLAVWTLEFTTSATGGLTAGHDIFLRAQGVNFHGSTVGSVSLGGEFVYPPAGWVATRSILSAVPDRIRFTLRAGEGASLAAGATGRMTFTMQNPTARTIQASDITVWTTKDTTPGAATADVIITPKPGPKLTGLFVAPQGFSIQTGRLEDLTIVTLVDGQTAYTVDVPAGKRYLISGESTGNELSYHLGSEVVSTRLFDPAKEPVKTHATGSTVAIRVANDAGAFTDYTVTLNGTVVCQNGGTAVNGTCSCPLGFVGTQCQIPQATQLAFDREPAGAVADTALTTQPRVAMQGPNGATVTSADTVTLRIKPGTGTAGAVLTATPKAAVAGIATFTDVKIDRAGTGYVLEATSGTLTLAESEPFDVSSGTPTLATLSLAPASGSTGFSRIDVTVVPGQLEYEVTVPAYDVATRTPEYNISATMSDPAAQIRITRFGGQFDPTGIAVQSGGTITFIGTNSAGTSPTYTVRLRAQARPTLTALALVPLTAAGTIDVNVPFSDYPRADLTGGRTEFTLPVWSGRSYRVDARADSGEITYRRNGISFDPATTRLSLGDTVTIQAVNDAGTSPTYRVRLGEPQTSVTAVTIAASPLAAGAATTITAVAKYTTALVAADTITVKMTGYTFAAGSVQVTAGTGITGTLTGTVVADALDTVVITGATIAAATSATFTFQATNPATAGAIAATGLTVHTSTRPRT